jgi:hypothetical protein
MSLNLNIAQLAGPGRRPSSVVGEYVRDLEAADMNLFATVDLGSPAPQLKKLSDRHHAVARLIASGVSEASAAMTLGYETSRIAALKASPAFQELLALYRRDVDSKFSTVLDHMAGLSRDALLELRERMEEEPLKFSNRELLSIATELTDRTKTGDEFDKNLPTRIELVAYEKPADVPPAVLPAREGNE